MYTKEQIKAIASIEPQEFCLKSNVQTLCEFYKWVKEEVTPCTIEKTKKALGLNLRKREDRMKLAHAIAIQLNGGKPDPTPTERKDTLVNLLTKVIALLPPVPPTNGLEDAPGWRLFGSPIYIHELDAGYSALHKTYHPDVNPSPDSTKKMSVINRIYDKLREDWTLKYSPLLPKELITDEIVELAMGVNLEIDPEETWESAKHNYPKTFKVRMRS